MENKKGIIYLIPNVLGENTENEVIPAFVANSVLSLKHFIVEDIKNARRYLKKLQPTIVIDDLQFYVLNKHTDVKELTSFIQPAHDGYDIGIISEAGCPGIADPGADIVKIAHQKNIRVIPLVGPSSILLTLMASGLNGQSFAFHGYLPIDKPERIKKLKALEKLIHQENQTQLFMETPFRNNQLFADVLANCDNSLRFCVAADLTTPTEFIKTQSIEKWKQNVIDIHKRPVMFALGR